MHHGCCAAYASCQGSVPRRDRVGRIGKFARMILMLSVNILLRQSQKPNLLALQKRLHSQLMKQHLPPGSEGSLSSQHAALNDALQGRRVCIAVDDCWYLFANDFCSSASL